MRFLSVLAIVTALVTSALAQNPEFTLRLDVGQLRETTKYRQLLQDIRQRAKNPNHISHNLPVCFPQQPNTTPLNQIRFFDIVLSSGQQASLRVRFRRDNLYIFGWKNELVPNAQWLELEHTGAPTIIPGARAVGFTGHYTELHGAAQQNRDQIPLGLTALQNAVVALPGLPPTNRQAVGRHVLVLIQMICEATRFLEIQNWIIANWRANPTMQQPQGLGANPTQRVIALESNWGALSASLLAMDQNGGAQFQPSNNPQLQDLRTVNSVVAIMGILLN